MLHFYKKDFINLAPKLFQQDCVKVHSSKKSRIEIKNLFGDNLGPKLNGGIIPRWT